MAKLYFYYSAMNAGKTTTLLQSSYNYNERGLSTLLFKPKIDNRDGEHISSRIGLSSEAVLFENDFDFFEYVKSLKIDHACLLIDEAQFLTKAQVFELTRVVDELNIPILCYGLRSDFQGEPFEGSTYLLTLADSLIELKTICYCGRKASMNMRIDAEGKPVKYGAKIEIGGNARYAAMCRKHFFESLRNM